jgi:hypothetical protein
MVTQEELMAMLASEADPPVPGTEPEAALWEMTAEGELTKTPALKPIAPVEIVTVEAAEDALAVRLNIEANLLAAQARTKAILANCKALEAVEQRRLGWWEWIFGAAVRKFARTQLKGDCKTAKFAHGQVQYRSTRGTHTIVSMDEAVGWMRARRPVRVRVEESVTVTDVLAVAAELNEQLPGWIKATAPEERANIVSGVGVSGVGK